MNFRPQKKNDIELNVTSFIDVVLLLLIFFMVSTTFGKKSEVSITLPEATERPAVAEPDTINISVDSRNRVFINDNPLVNSQLATIRESLRQAMGDMKNPVVVINADAEATHQSVIRVMDAARQLSLTRITFATRILDEQTSSP